MATGEAWNPGPIPMVEDSGEDHTSTLPGGERA